MVRVDAIGDVCPVPVVKAKNAIKEMEGESRLEILVDNSIAVQNLTKMAVQKGYEVSDEQLPDGNYKVVMDISDAADAAAGGEDDSMDYQDCDIRKRTSSAYGTVAVISSDVMGAGSDELGRKLMKAFIFALGQQDVLPDTLIFFNGGAHFTCEGSESLPDIVAMEEQGTKVFTCGTCLDYYGLKEKLSVGSISNMYDIVEMMEDSDRLIRP